MFHANTEDYIKEFVTKSFSTIHGTVRVLVATIAFGLGIEGLQTVIHYDPPASLGDYFQESGRCGRNGKQSVAISILYPRCITTIISKGMTEYCKNYVLCRTKLLLEEFGKLPSKIESAHLCCDISQKLCQCKENCNSDVTSEVLYNLTIDHGLNYESIDSPGLTKNAMDDLRNKLFDIWDKYVHQFKGVHTSIDVISGFPFQAIEEIIKNVRINFNMSDLMEMTSVLDRSIFPIIKSAIDEVIELHEFIHCESAPNLLQLNEVLEGHSDDSDFSYGRYKPKIVFDSDEYD